MVNHHSQNGYHFSQDSQITHHFQDGQLDLEFDSSATQFVDHVDHFDNVDTFAVAAGLLIDSSHFEMRLWLLILLNWHYLQDINVLIFYFTSLLVYSAA